MFTRITSSLDFVRETSLKEIMAKTKPQSFICPPWELMICLHSLFKNNRRVPIADESLASLQYHGTITNILLFLE